MKIQDQISTIQATHSDELKALSFFSGAMGLDIGLHRAGINTLLACEINKFCRQTIIKNQPNIGLIGDIRDYSIADILKYANLTDCNEVDLIVGGPPCQAFSTAGKRLGFEDERGNVFLKFIEVIETIQPKYAVIENVRGLFSSAYNIALASSEKDLLPEQYIGKKGSTLYYILNRFKKSGYNVSFNLYNSANYGTPQVRERVIMICTLAENKVPYLTPTHSNDKAFNLLPWRTLKDAIHDLPDSPKDHINFPEKRLKYFRMLKAGQNWRNLPEELQPEAIGKAYYLVGGKTGFLRRLSWEKPSPTIVTNPAMPATDLAHPDEDRPLSVQEYKRLQEFPDDWELCGNTTQKYKQIGNAIPISVGQAIGKEILNHHHGINPKTFPGFKYSRYKNTSEISFVQAFEKKNKVKKDCFVPA